MVTSSIKKVVIAILNQRWAFIGGGSVRIKDRKDNTKSSARARVGFIGAVQSKGVSDTITDIRWAISMRAVLNTKINAQDKKDLVSAVGVKGISDAGLDRCALGKRGILRVILRVAERAVFIAEHNQRLARGRVGRINTSRVKRRVLTEKANVCTCAALGDLGNAFVNAHSAFVVIGGIVKT